jgi:hypothetical protein
LLKALDEVMVEDTAGDPISGLKWTHKSLPKIQTALDEAGYALSPPTISRLLQEGDYSLQVNHKYLARKVGVESKLGLYSNLEYKLGCCRAAAESGHYTQPKNPAPSLSPG